MRYIVLFVLGLFGLQFGIAAGAADARPAVAKYGAAYRGQGNIVVWTVGVGDLDKGEYLLQYTGVNHAWDMKILKVTRVPSTRKGADWTLKVDGQDYVTLVERSPWGDSKNYEIYLPGGPRGLSVHYDEGLSREMKPEHMLTEYLQQAEK